MGHFSLLFLCVLLLSVHPDKQTGTREEASAGTLTGDLAMITRRGGRKAASEREAAFPPPQNDSTTSTSTLHVTPPADGPTPMAETVHASNLAMDLAASDTAAAVGLSSSPGLVTPGPLQPQSDTNSDFPQQLSQQLSSSELPVDTSTCNMCQSQPDVPLQQEAPQQVEVQVPAPLRPPYVHPGCQSS
eukprot:6210964-Pleurochrysis_carterae.AAC.1